ncbi:MAG: hypothetical protein ABI595_03535 [Actinomycetota bacterium]
MRGRPNRATLVALGLTFALAASACGSGDPSPSTSPSSVTPTVSADRPASPAKLSIVTPKNGQVVRGTTVEMKLSLKDAKIVQATSADIVPDEGHLHVILDDQLISMTGTTTQLLSNLGTGQHLLKVEFVASDHAPFDPRVIAAVSFEVQA